MFESIVEKSLQEQQHRNYLDPDNPQHYRSGPSTRKNGRQDDSPDPLTNSPDTNQNEPTGETMSGRKANQQWQVLLRKSSTPRLLLYQQQRRRMSADVILSIQDRSEGPPMKTLLRACSLLLLVSFLLLPTSPVSADTHGAQIGPGLIRYTNPMHEGHRLDWCLSWAAQCGEPAASAWCRSKKFAQANSWSKARDIGATASTKVFQNGRICDKPFCDGFSEIVCEDLEPGLFFDFISQASTARWTNNWQPLPFPGTPSDSKGFVRLLENAGLENRRIYRRVLETHPQWRPRGRITGRYSNITIPAHGAEFRAEIGFLNGAAASDGAYFEIWAEFPQYQGISLRREYHKKFSGSLINAFSQDLSLFRGMTGTIALTVEAGEQSSTQDWVAWVNPRLISLENEYTFASFVGGAIGSRRNGNKLLNPWGGKSGHLYGNVMLYLAFAHVQRDYSIRIDSYHRNRFMGTTNLGTVRAGQKELWTPLSRTQEGPWRERVVFNGTYVGDLRYTISRIGE